MFLGPEKIIEKKKKFLCPPNQIHFYVNPPEFVKGEGQYLFDSNGKKYTDFFSGVSVMNCGHSNTEIQSAVIDQLKQLQHTSIIYLTEPIVQLAEKLSGILPGNLNKCFFTCTGSEANETAMQMAKLYNGKTHFIALEGGLHGRTYQTMSVTGIPMWRSDVNLLDTVHFVKRYDEDTAIESVLSVIESVGSDKISAMIVEPIQGNGGIVVPQNDYFVKLKKVLEEHEILLIVDEVQTGFARTGSMFAIENFDVVPDIMTVAKALGNGFPVSAACTNDQIAERFNKPSASTLGAAPVCAAAGIAVIDYIQKNNLIESARKLGRVLSNSLNQIKAKYPEIVTSVRGYGLMQGMELKTPTMVDHVLEIALQKGFIVGKNGIERNVLAFQPPLVIGEQDIKELERVLEEALSQIDRE